MREDAMSARLNLSYGPREAPDEMGSDAWIILETCLDELIGPISSPHNPHFA